MDAVPSGLPIESEFEEDPAVDSSHSAHDARFVHHDMAPALEVDLELTPNSITRLLSKYSLDASSIVGPDIISPKGSLAGFREGHALDAFRVKYHSAKAVIVM
ncbi:hypothetical protein Nepgr_029712 [Nepenthes gracilis]|uniref:Uncharacterized protein n=1 Tax=Nepenthes gracilis TaxID=150966 RepID=A0AAD3Y5C6_NEPGR|nr:hypothetical protein Nepgr_029712 [Nepenthes gracilis]